MSLQLSGKICRTYLSTHVGGAIDIFGVVLSREVEKLHCNAHITTQLVHSHVEICVENKNKTTISIKNNINTTITTTLTNNSTTS